MPEHPFYVKERSHNDARPKPIGHEDLNSYWVGAGHLKIGDKIKQADGTTGVVANVTTVQQTQEMFNLTVDEAHTFYVGQNGWLVHNGCPTLPAPITFNRGQIKYTLEQGDNKTGWTHIFNRHVDPAAATKYADSPDMFDPSLTTMDIMDLLGQTLKSGKQVGTYYGQPIIEFRTNFKGVGYQTYRVTLDTNGTTIRTFHPATQPLTNPKVVK